MKKICVLAAILMAACVGSSEPRNPMKAQPATVDSKTPSVKRCDNRGKRKRIRLLPFLKGKTEKEMLEEQEKQEKKYF